MDNPYPAIDGPSNTYIDYGHVSYGHATPVGIARRSVGDFTIKPRRGYVRGAAYASTDISAQGQHNQFMISVDGRPPVLVTISVAGKTSGPAIAAELQSRIRALGSIYAGVTVTFTTTRYTIYSGTEGGTSRVVTMSAPDPARDIAAALRLDYDMSERDGGWYRWPILDAKLRFEAVGLTEYPVPPFRFWYSGTCRTNENYWAEPLIAPMTKTLSLGTFPAYDEDGITLISQQYEVPVLNWKTHLLPQFINDLWPSECPAAICLENETEVRPTAFCHAGGFAPAYYDLEDLPYYWNNCAVQLSNVHLRIYHEIKSATILNVTPLEPGPAGGRTGKGGPGLR